MPISQQDISGSIVTPTGENAQLTSVTFTLTGSDYEDGELIAAKSFEAEVTPDTGDFTVTLWPNDMGMEGNTNYTFVANFNDGSKVTNVKSLFVKYSPSPKTLEDVAFETKAAGALKPSAFRVTAAAAFAAEAVHPLNTYSVIRD